MPDAQQQQFHHAFKTALDHLSKGNAGAAIPLLRGLIVALPKAAEPRFHLARALLATGAASEASDTIHTVTGLKPDEVDVWRLAVAAHQKAGKTDLALAAHDAVIRLSGNALKPQVDKALYLQQLGQFQDAETLFRKLIKKHPNEGQLYRIFLGTKKLTAGDPLIAAMAKAMNHPKQTPNGKMHLGYALAKAYDDSAAPDRVFAPLNVANRLQAKAFPFDRGQYEREIDGVLRAQADLPNPLETNAAPDPIYVIGMPRSGTTLVERVIAAHPDVIAGGEMGDHQRLAYTRFGAGEAMVPATADSIAAYATDLRATLVRRTQATTPYVTDKSINTGLILGLISTALPKARFVIVDRDPHAIALSIYKNFFAEGTHRYANRLEDIAWMIHRHRRTLAVWQDKMPDRLIRIAYEDLVQSPEQQTRALIGALGLEWNDACLSPHTSGGAVQTLSLYQVRQPIQSTRADAWRAHAKDLKPFTDAWEALTHEPE